VLLGNGGGEVRRSLGRTHSSRELALGTPWAETLVGRAVSLEQSEGIYAALVLQAARRDFLWTPY